MKDKEQTERAKRVSKMIDLIEAFPVPSSRVVLERSEATGNPRLIQLRWTVQGWGERTVSLKCAPSKTALLYGKKRALWLRVGDVLVDDQPIGTGEKEFRITYEEYGDSPLDGLTDLLNESLSVPLKL